MKQVLLSILPPQAVAVEGVNPDLYFGVNINGETGFITQEGYCTGKYTALSSRGLTHRNGWDLLANPNLSKMIEGLLKRGFKVYEFDTPKELWSWMAKNTV